MTYRIATVWRANQGRFVMKRLVGFADRDIIEEHRLVV